VAAFVLVFEITQRPRRATDHRARESVGVGSFNLLKLGSLPPGGDSPGHPPTSQRRHEARQVAEGDGVLAGSRLRDRVRHVEWHKTLAGAVKGLDKSIFPGADYRLSAISSRAAPQSGCSSGPMRWPWPPCTRTGRGFLGPKSPPLHRAASLRDRGLDLRHAQVRLRGAGERGYRVAGHRLTLEPVEGGRVVIRTSGARMAGMLQSVRVG
jgi:hypothetical protein